jgi:replication-associated recombination protein RarA
MPDTTIRGYKVDEVVASLRDAIRVGDERQACWWAVELDQSGFGERLWYHLAAACAGDVGLAWPQGPVVLAALQAAYDLGVKKDPRDGRLQVVHATLVLVRAPKSPRVQQAMEACYGSPKRMLDVPDYALDMHTSRGRMMGRGRDGDKGRKHWHDEASKLVNRVDVDEVCADGCQYVPGGGGCGVELAYHDEYWACVKDEAMWWEQKPRARR